MWLLNTVAAAVGKTAQLIRPPRPPRTYHETPEVVSARLAYEEAQRALDRQLAINKATQRELDKNAKVLAKEHKRLMRQQERILRG